MTKCGERKPRSNCMPCTTTTSVSAVLPSTSTVMTLLEAAHQLRHGFGESFWPISGLLFDAMVATSVISLLSLSSIFSAIRCSSVTTASTAFWMPRDSAIGSQPAAIALSPSRNTASASTVAVVVPSPATSLVLLAASFTS